ncbi:DUF5666 domain-containing protein [Nocardia sp. NPDC057668]|uniref:DUF5666 domain-containing protein n=1 Tax=Nocardia sp. NPDC057668 TaxID=3346202 RepID=UPI0036700285
MTNPSDPWARRPDVSPGEGPTEKMAPAPGQVGHTSDPADAYGPTEYFGVPPGPEATRVIPPHDAGWGGYEQGAGYEPTAAYQAGAGYVPTSTYDTAGGYVPQPPPNYPGGPGAPGGYPPAGFPRPPAPEPPRRTGLWIGLGLAALAGIAVIGVAVGVLLANRNTPESPTAAGTTAAPTFVFPSKPNTSSQPLPSGVPQIPGLGDIDSLGANMGTIAANDGTTLTMTTLAGTTVTVHTDEETQVISLGSTKVADLPVGEMVMVQGDKGADGSIQATIIISTSLPGGPR